MLKIFPMQILAPFDDCPTSELPIVHTGSVKIIRRDSEKVLAFEHTDKFSVFDCGPHPQEIPEMGVNLCRMNVSSFKVAQALKIPTHFIAKKDERTIFVREFATPKDRPLNPGETDVMLPLEWIDRSHVSGSLRRAFLESKKKPTDYGFRSDDRYIIPTEGDPLPFPVHECTTKWEKVDRPLTVKEATVLIGGITEVEWHRSWAIIDRLNGALSLAAKAAGFTRLDGKKELAFSGPKRQIVVIDAFGNPHEDRYAPTLRLEQGEVIHFSKEFLRQLFIKNGFFATVKEARKANQPDPPYLPLPAEDILEASRRFKILADAYEVAVNNMVG